MKRSAQKVHSTTQKFTEIVDIIDDVVILSGNQACLVLEIVATNFSLQSAEEQQSKILSYASLLNSLSFSIQIVVISRKLDISSYIKLLADEAQKTKSPTLSSHITMYKDFVSETVKVNTVLDKKFYVIIPYFFLEKGAGAAREMKDKNLFAKDAKSLLKSKAASVVQQLIRVGLKSKILGQNELTALFYEIYNADPGSNASQSAGQAVTNSKT